MRRFASATLAFATAACTTVPVAPMVASGSARPEGSLVALGQPVAVADIVLTPIHVIEDSRCPINARCVWAGRIVVETRIDGAGWRESMPLTLGEPQWMRGYSLVLVSAEPGQIAGGKAVQPEEYRFAYEGRWAD